MEICLFGFFQMATWSSNLEKLKKKKKQNTAALLSTAYSDTKHFADMIVSWKVFTNDCDDAKWIIVLNGLHIYLRIYLSVKFPVISRNLQSLRSFFDDAACRVC